MEVYINLPVVKEIAEFDIASNIPAWIFAERKCQNCLYGFSESLETNKQIYQERIVVAVHDHETYLFHSECFSKAKVKKWI